MDSTNERKMHKTVVDVATKANTSQYVERLQTFNKLPTPPTHRPSLTRALTHRPPSTPPSNSPTRYFLITPKLLPDLDYNDRVKVHCIYNGPGQPPRAEWRPEVFLQRMRERALQQPAVA